MIMTTQQYYDASTILLKYPDGSESLSTIGYKFSKEYAKFSTYPIDLSTLKQIMVHVEAGDNNVKLWDMTKQKCPEFYEYYMDRTLEWYRILWICLCKGLY